MKKHTHQQRPLHRTIVSGYLVCEEHERTLQDGVDEVVQVRGHCNGMEWMEWNGMDGTNVSGRQK